ncbi:MULTISPECIES: putative quinol monooxygenase [Helcobacillus]|uniref:Quinol monooxygenase YgiN n=1 Tax=Helcobacillus massiliensis TaxID=521392 RepID=A0A839QSX0_9MICO|nr:MULTISPECIES: putative quinol monooxygenase [Helcobacillus]MBB3022748.1 quinol monooxygenase YgiN [Helcobacillus massiliensis]MCG7426319.1 antibiotic biosynthesis monooxygenase [Helcobacillus sp. ACRRO]MDK7742916.1 putative quinol monooxygenase [Helcobacillus massiliensis]WOO92091.1 putative quinol monooxygenase [Helcobacillus massiliensis]
MILINVKYTVKDGQAEEFLEAVGEFTAATRAEEGNLWFDWYRSTENENEVLLVEAFKDDAGEAHVSSDHFAAGLEAMKPFLTATPQIISRTVDGEGWDRMGELKVD